MAMCVRLVIATTDRAVGMMIGTQVAEVLAEDRHVPVESAILIAVIIEFGIFRHVGVV